MPSKPRKDQKRSRRRTPSSSSSASSSSSSSSSSRSSNSSADKYKHKSSASRRRKDDESAKQSHRKKVRMDQQRKQRSPSPVIPDMKPFDITTKAGGAYIPPAKLRMMQQQIEDKSSEQYQRISWEALKKSINGLINKVNIGNIVDIVQELFAENLIRGRGIFVKSILAAQAFSTTFTHVYAALVSIVNTKLPQVGELLLRRLIINFRRGYKRNDKAMCLSSLKFIAHLVNQQVAHELLALEILMLLLEKPTDDSVEITIGFLKECGSKLRELSPKASSAIFDRLRNILHEAKISLRVQYMIEVFFSILKDKFKDYPSVIEQLDLVDEEDQFTHMLALDDDGSDERLLDVFKLDPEFTENEAKYAELKTEILGLDGSDDDGGDGDDIDADEDEDNNEIMRDEAGGPIIDNTEQNLVLLRKTVYLTIQNSLTFDEAVHKLLKLKLKPEQEPELCAMVLDCCAQLRTYENFYGLMAERLCRINKKYSEPFENMFREQYETCHRLETMKLRNVATFFAHLLATDSISWAVLSSIKMTEDDTTSSGRIFVKIVFQRLAETCGIVELNDRLEDSSMAQFFVGLFPTNDPRDMRFSINFFTAIGLGGLTESLRKQLKSTTKEMKKKKLIADQPAAAPSSSSSSSSSSDSSDSSGSESDDSSR